MAYKISVDSSKTVTVNEEVVHQVVAIFTQLMNYTHENCGLLFCCPINEPAWEKFLNIKAFKLKNIVHFNTVFFIVGMNVVFHDIIFTRHDYSV